MLILLISIVITEHLVYSMLLAHSLRWAVAIPYLKAKIVLRALFAIRWSAHLRRGVVPSEFPSGKQATTKTI